MSNLGGIFMEKEILKEVYQECDNWKEKLIVKFFPDLFIKIYGKIGMKIFNNINRNI